MLQSLSNFIWGPISRAFRTVEKKILKTEVARADKVRRSFFGLEKLEKRPSHLVVPSDLSFQDFLDWTKVLNALLIGLSLYKIAKLLEQVDFSIHFCGLAWQVSCPLAVLVKNSSK